MNNNINDFENRVLQVINKVLSEKLFSRVGLTPKVGKLKILNSGAENYESEINIDFYDTNGICDVIEFHLYKGGAPIAKIEEIEKWLSESFDSVIQEKLREYNV